jgi:sugar phosphate isomerase/epimerase
MQFYYSTSCLIKNHTYLEILDIYDKLKIKNVELGVCLDYNIDVTELTRKFSFNYIVHQLFPPPKEPFVLNLASENREILNKSLEQIKRSIDFCAKSDIPLLSFHSGFRSDPDSYFKFNFTKILDYKTSFDIFKNSLKNILEYATVKNIKIAIENNVLSEYNLIEGKNKLLLMCELWEYERLFEDIDTNNFGLILDLGHLKVTANLLRFDASTFIRSLRRKIFAVHIHENNASLDEHTCVKEGDWALDIVRTFFNNNKIPIVNECVIHNEKELEKMVNFYSKI